MDNFIDKMLKCVLTLGPTRGVCGVHGDRKLSVNGPMQN